MLTRVDDDLDADLDADLGADLSADLSADIDARDRAAEANARFRPVEVDGEVVTRPASEATPTIHAVLRHLREQGLEGIPEPIGIAGDSETLRFLPGDSGGDGWFHQHSDAGLASAARFLRRVHDASVGYRPQPDAVWGAVPDARPGTDGHVVLCHGDPGPWNFVWHEQEAVGLLDWDFLHPGPRVDDVAYALRWFVPLRADQHVLDWHHFPEVPDRRHRVGVFLEAYGDLPELRPDGIAAAVTARMRSTCALMSDLAARGVEPQRTWVADGAVERELEEARWVEEHRHLFE